MGGSGADCRQYNRPVRSGGDWFPAGLLWQLEAPRSLVGWDWGLNRKGSSFFKLLFLNTLFYTVVGTFFMLKSALSSSVKGIPCLFMELMCQNKGKGRLSIQASSIRCKFILF